MSDSTDSMALHDFLNGESLKTIRDKYGFRSTSTALAAIQRELKAVQSGKDPDTARRIEVERIDAMERVVYPLALTGDSGAIRQCMELGERRLRLLDAPSRVQNGLLKSYEKTVRELRDNREVDGEDEALIQSGRMIAAQIDYATRNCVGQEVTKALYLVPHLMNVLSALGATPEARRKMQEMASGQKREEPVDELTAFRQKKFGTG